MPDLAPKQVPEQVPGLAPDLVPGLAAALARAQLTNWTARLLSASEAAWQQPHGDTARWQHALRALPPVVATRIDLNAPAVRAAGPELSAESAAALRAALLALQPWRKGPFDLFGICIDSEWRSNLKWQRLRNKITPLRQRRVLDVGCGNGYYLLRMRGAGASLALGIEPTRLFQYQFAALQTYLQCDNCFVLPLKSQALPGAAVVQAQGFDTVFSMGVLYHHRATWQHLVELRNCLRRDGELVLETLILPGTADTELAPTRYAQMRNVWCLPSLTRLKKHLRAADFTAIEVLDISRTTIDEQRTTEWMRFDSLANFLSPEDNTRTVEGYPAPTRAIVRARRAR